MAGELTTIAATIGALLGIINLLIWLIERRPEIDIEIESAESEIRQDDYFFTIELLVHNRGEKLTAICSTEYNLQCINKTERKYYEDPLFLSAHSSRRLKDSFQCDKLPNECEIEITLYHTHGKHKLKRNIPIKLYYT